VRVIGMSTKHETQEKHNVSFWCVCHYDDGRQSAIRTMSSERSPIGNTGSISIIMHRCGLNMLFYKWPKCVLESGLTVLFYKSGSTWATHVLLSHTTFFTRLWVLVVRRPLEDKKGGLDKMS